MTEHPQQKEWIEGRQHNKTTYACNGYVAKIVSGIEKVTVRRIKEKKVKDHKRSILGEQDIAENL